MTYRSLLSACLLLVLPVSAAAQIDTYTFVPQVDDVVTPIFTRTQAALTDITVGSGPEASVPSPDGRWVFVTNQGDGTVSVIEMSSRNVVDLITLETGPGGPFSIAFSPDSRTAYATTQANAGVWVIDVETRTVQGPIIPVGSAARGIAITPDGLTALVGTDDGMVPITLATRAVGAAIGTGPLLEVAISPDGQLAFGANQLLSNVEVVDVATLTAGTPIQAGDAPTGLMVSPDGTRLYVTNFVSATVSRIDMATLLEIDEIPVGAGPMGVGFTADGRYVYVANDSVNSVSIIDTTTSTVIGTVALPSMPIGFGKLVSPPLIVATGGPLNVANDAALTTTGFLRFVPFLGGTLRLTGALTTSRTLSMVSSSSTTDTNGFDAAVDGGIVGQGTWTKAGAGTLRLAGVSPHSGDTFVSAGTLAVNGTHAAGPITTTGGTLAGSGTVGPVTVTSGTLAPGDGVGILHASQVTVAGAGTLAIQLAGTTVGTGYDRLDVTGTTTIQAGATLAVTTSFTPPLAATFLIATNATGTFAGLVQGATFTAGGHMFQISYTGGDGNDVVLTVVDQTAPPAPVLGPLTSQRVTESGTLGVALSVTPDDPQVVCAATSSNDAIVSNTGLAVARVNGALVLSIAPRAAAVGEVTISVSCTLAGQGSNVVPFTLTVTPTTYYMAEGATGTFFDTDISILNPNNTPVDATVTLYREGSALEAVRTITMPALSRTVLQPETIPGFEAAAFSSRVMSLAALPLAVERTMRWDAGSYGAHTERATPGLFTHAYFAEGSQGFFSTYVLLTNPYSTAITAHVTYFREAAPPIVRDFTLPARARTTIDVGADAALVNRSFGLQVDFSQPAVAERVMYFGATPFWAGGHESAATTSPSTSWFLAEGATGSYFTTFVLLANPGSAAANVTLTYLPTSGQPITRTVVVPAGQRVTINIALEDASLASAAVATQVTSDQPILVERSQYWGFGAWIESHNSAGVTATSRRWGVADGRVGGTDAAQTYILLANTGATTATVTATFVRDTGAPIVKTFIVAPTSRFNVAVSGPGSQVPELADERFSAVIDSTQPIVVERSVYSNSGGVVWAAGTNATGTPLP